jgi:hypothetical protein
LEFYGEKCSLASNLVDGSGLRIRQNDADPTGSGFTVSHCTV